MKNIQYTDIQSGLKSLSRLVSDIRARLTAKYVPTRLQYQTTECGVAALAMMLAHHGHHVSMEELRHATGVSRDCLNADDIQRAAQHYGLDVKIYKGEPNALRRLEFPFLAHLNFIHFVVVEGMTSDQVLINDPSNGRTEIPIEKFHDIFTGIVMTFRPTGEFTPNNQKHTLFQNFLRRIDKTSIAFTAMAFIFACLSALMLIGLSDIWSNLLADFIQHNTAVPTIIFTFIATVALYTGLVTGQDILLSRACARMSGRMARSLLDRLLCQPFSYLSYRLAHEQVKSVEDIDRIARLIWRDLLPALFTCPPVAALLYVLWKLDSLVAGTIALILFLNIAALMVTALWRAGTQREEVRTDDKDFREIFSDLMTIEKDKVANLDRDFIATRMGKQAARSAIRQHNAIPRIVGRVLSRMSGYAIVMAATTLSVQAHMAGTLDTHDLITALVLSMILAYIIRDWPLLRGKLSALQLALLRQDDLMTGMRDGTDQSTSSPSTPSTPSTFRFQDITFGHSPTRAPLLNGLDFSFHSPDEQVGITGPSGSGKSSFAVVAAGLQDPWSGTADINARVKWIDKTPFIFEGTIRENLRLWRDDIDDDTLWQALRHACLDDVIRARPEGLNAHIVARGWNFSGGQRQRLEIARALTYDPEVLILDEALDALNPGLEAQIRANLRERNCALIIVSHRTSTLQSCDRILHFHNGCLLDTQPEAPSQPEASPQIDRFLENIDQPSRGSNALSSHATQSTAYYSRKVRFQQKRFWQRTHLPLIGQRLEDAKLFDLLPGMNGYHIKGEKKSRSLDTIASTALCVYLPAAQEAQGSWALLRTWFASATFDIIRAIGFAFLFAVTLLLSFGFTNLPLFDLPQASAWKAGVSILGLMIIIGLMDTLVSLSMLRAAHRIDLTAQADLYQRLIHTRVDFFTSAPREALARALATIYRLLKCFDQGAAEACLYMTVTLCALMGLGMLNPNLALLVAALCGSLTLPSWLCSGFSTKAQMKLDDSALTARRFLHDTMSGITRLRSAEATAQASAHWHDLNIHRINASSRLDRIRIWGQAIDTLWLFAALSIVTSVAVATTPDTIDSLGNILYATLLAWLCFDASGRTATVIARIRKMTGFILSLDLLLKAPKDATGAVPTRGAEISLKDLIFSYDGVSGRAIDGVSLSISAGETIALVGPSGSGKSTLLKLLLGFEVPSGGTIHIDGHPLEHTNLRAWRTAIGVVQQNDRLEQSSTIRNHIAGLADVNMEDIWHAADMAALSDDIRAMPMGMMTIVEHGTLSTGQEQRLMIARQFLRQPALLVMDEATNAIPEDTQSRILENLRRAGICCILATHRESAITAAERVVLLQDGRLSWSGTSDAFMRNDEFLSLIRREKTVEEPV